MGGQPGTKAGEWLKSVSIKNIYFYFQPHNQWLGNHSKWTLDVFQNGQTDGWWRRCWTSWALKCHRKWLGQPAISQETRSTLGSVSLGNTWRSEGFKEEVVEEETEESNSEAATRESSQSTITRRCSEPQRACIIRGQGNRHRPLSMHHYRATKWPMNPNPEKCVQRSDWISLKIINKLYNK